MEEDEIAVEIPYAGNT